MDVIKETNDIFKKLSDMSNLFIHNNPLFVYRFHHYIKTNVSKRIAMKYSKKNREFYAHKNIELIWNDTYDCSCQVCHPDIAFWNNEYWMVGTPYPYGLEEYENPSLWHGKSVKELKPYNIAPIAFPTKRGYGSHLSDPCLSVIENNLWCFYRDTVNLGNGTTKNRFCYKVLTSLGNLSDEKELLSSEKDGLLSPAVVLVGKSLFLFFVSYVDTELIVKMSEVNNGVVDDIVYMNISNIEDDWDVWHFDLKNYYGNIVGLFLLRNKNNKTEFKLKKGIIDIRLKTIELTEDIPVEKVLDDFVLHPYKSCLYPDDKNKMLLSYRDKNAVYILKEVDMRGRKNEE